MELSVILPCYNGEKRVARTVERIADYLRGKGLVFELVVVNDGSEDRTLEVLQQLQRRYRELAIHTYAENRGKGFAVREGVRRARFPHILFLDVDLATPIESLDNFFPHLAEADVLIGSRAVRGAVIRKAQPWGKVVIGRIGNALIQAILLPGISDTQCGFKMFSRASAHDAFSRARIDRWGFDFEILYLARKFGYRILELPVTWTDSGESHVTKISYLKTWGELILVRINDLRGLYRKNPNDKIQMSNQIQSPRLPNGGQAKSKV